MGHGWQDFTLCLLRYSQLFRLSFKLSYNSKFWRWLKKLFFSGYFIIKGWNQKTIKKLFLLTGRYKWWWWCSSEHSPVSYSSSESGKYFHLQSILLRIWYFWPRFLFLDMIDLVIQTSDHLLHISKHLLSTFFSENDRADGFTEKCNW